MRIIAEECKTIQVILGEQKILPGKYRPSMFNFILHDQEALLFNSFTRMLAILSAEECDILSKEEIEVLEDSALSAALRQLITKRLLVPTKIDEADSYMQLCDMLQLMQKPTNISDYTILTTTACNARCFYCFEADFKPTAMKNSTANDLADYIIAHSGMKKVGLHWFGGEPLCNTKAIDIICEKLRNANLPYSSTITSNGLLFNDELVQKAKEDWKVGMVQITLDGMDEEHNRRKNFYAGTVENPFRVIISNIHRLLKEKIYVSVRLNFDENNIEDTNALIDFLTNEFAGEKYFGAYPSMLFEDCGAWNPERLPEAQQLLVKQVSVYRDLMRERGLFTPPTPNKELKIERCGSNRKSHRTVNPDGSFSVCHNVSDCVTYGSIYEGISDEERFEKWMRNTRLTDRCRRCLWLPECTAFDQCPIRKSTCIEEQNDMIARQVRSSYEKFIAEEAKKEGAEQ